MSRPVDMDVQLSEYPALLHVAVLPDGLSWFAQSLEWDYAASGDDFLDVKSNFKRGLERTVAEQYKRFGRLTFTAFPTAEWESLVAERGCRVLFLRTDYLHEI